MNWIIVGQGPTVLSVDAVVGCVDILVDVSIEAGILSQRAIKPTSTKQQTFRCRLDDC